MQLICLIVVDFAQLTCIMSAEVVMGLSEKKIKFMHFLIKSSSEDSLQLLFGYQICKDAGLNASDCPLIIQSLAQKNLVIVGDAGMKMEYHVKPTKRGRKWYAQAVKRLHKNAVRLSEHPEEIETVIEEEE